MLTRFNLNKADLSQNNLNQVSSLELRFAIVPVGCRAKPDAAYVSAAACRRREVSGIWLGDRYVRLP